MGSRRQGGETPLEPWRLAGDLMHRCVGAQREAQEDPGGSGKAGGAKGMMYSVMYSGVASGVYDLWDGARDGHNDVIMDSLNR